jgi:hypothetical protein
MRWNHFAGSLAFAALATAGFPFAKLLLDPILGWHLGTQLYLVATAALYPFFVAPNLRRGVAGACLVALFGMGLLFASTGTTDLALGLAVGVAVARSALLYRTRVARAVAIELTLGLGGLVLARWFGGPGTIGASLGLWGYWLAQSLYFPLAGCEPRRDEQAGDAFDEARTRLRALLRDNGA